MSKKSTYIITRPGVGMPDGAKANVGDEIKLTEDGAKALLNKVALKGSLAASGSPQAVAKEVAAVTAKYEGLKDQFESSAAKVKELEADNAALMKNVSESVAKVKELEADNAALMKAAKKG